jgi:hypothetical protein
MPVTVRAGNNALQAPGTVITIKRPGIALLRQRAEDLANDINVQGALPAERLGLSPYNTTVIDMGLGFSIVSIRLDNDIFNLAVRESARESQPMVRLFIGPASIQVSHGTVVKRLLDLSQSPDGIQFATNMPWCTVADGWATIDARNLDPGNYAVAIQASGAATDDTVMEVSVS